MALTRLSQGDFSSGAFRGVARHLIPENGAYTLQNVLLDETGSVYKRGGSKYLTGTAFGTGLRWVWDGLLTGGQRTVVASSTAFGVVSADDASVISLGGPGSTFPPSYTVLGGVMYLSPGFAYAGSRRTVAYTAGTIAATNGSRTLTGTTTAWLANVDPGMIIPLGGHPYAVQSVNSDTQITLSEPYTGTTASGMSYSANPLLSLAATLGAAAPLYSTAGDRLFTASGVRVPFSEGRSTTGALRPTVFTGTNYHEMPAGSEVVGLQGLEDVMFVFTTGGVYVITNLFFDLTDDFGNVQQTVEPVSQDLILWGPAVTSWRNSLLCPMTDGVWLISRSEPPVKVSKSIDGLYSSYVRAGHRPGQTVVHDAHLFLPILSSTGAVVDLLVCRLDRPAQDSFGQTVWPWTWVRGHGGNVTALTARVGGQGTSRRPRLLAAGADGRVLDLTGFFSPDDTNALEADGTAPQWIVETRDVTTGNGNLNHVRRLRIRYELDGGTLAGFYSIGRLAGGNTLYGTATYGEGLSDATLGEFVALAVEAPTHPSGRDPYEWAINTRARRVRARLQSSAPSKWMAIRALDFSVRPSAKDR